MDIKTEYMKTEDLGKLLKMLKIAAKKGITDKEMCQHFNKVYAHTHTQTPEDHKDPRAAFRKR
ncbi:hypothetical protein M3N64_08265 [Sporolactobacillus sp. CPB3-1]|uniref:Uncharacterized protein n=1 Tax=Sporolactobacillus mangiferae TaxID=2940498 RepID=A0ABT0MAQ2_9BACL|nr:hypothetical protein [Sporolactobacillus mangiferae]MCL1631942.1 hypothetical protein [Sporolactobacillus mangiferae]